MTSNDFVAVAGNVPNIKVWGYVSWYTIPESVEIKDTDLYTLAIKHGIPSSYLPAKICKADAFRTATREVIPSKKVSQVKVDEIISDKDEIIRTFERPSSRELDQEILKNDMNATINADKRHIATARYDRNTDLVDIKVIDYNYSDMMKDVVTKYNRYSEFYTGDAIRRMTKNFIRDMSGISMRKSGGVEFIPFKNCELLKKFAGMLQEINSNCEIETIPLIPRDEIENQHQSNMIEKHLVDDISTNVADVIKLFGGDAKILSSKNTIKELITEFSLLLKDNQFTESKINGAVLKFNDQMALVKDYKELLQVNLTEIEDDLNLLKEQTRKIIAK